MEDTNYCVYLHRDVDGRIFYVGQGRRVRARTKCNGRASAWNKFAKNGFSVEIFQDNLTKDQAVKIEKELILRLRSEGHLLVNKSINDGNRTLTAEMFKDYFQVDGSSKYGLRKIAGYNAGTEVGTLVKKTGYVVINFKGPQYFIHRVIYAIHHGECPANMQVNHIDGNKQNNRIENLELVTSKENVKHAIDTGLTRVPKGQDCYAAILKDEDVLAMYEMFKLGKGNLEVAEAFGLDFKHVSLIRLGKRWEHLYKDHGPFSKSKTVKVYTKEVVIKAYELTKTTKLFNREIAEITGIETSQVSRIRNRKAFKVWLDEYDNLT